MHEKDVQEQYDPISLKEIFFSQKSDKKWLQENAFKISGFMWNILAQKDFWPVNVHEQRDILICHKIEQILLTV